jgi:hypothetical protein
MSLAIEKSGGNTIDEDIWITQEIKFSDNLNDLSPE